MNITVIGAGNAGSTIAADLTLKGHNVTLMKTSNKLHNEHFEYIKTNKEIVLNEFGKIRTVKIENVTTNYSEALNEKTELIIVYIQTNYHEELIKKIEPYLHDGQIILFEPGYLSTAYLLKHTNKKVVSVEAESSPIDCRIVKPGHCSVLFKNVRNPIAVYPKSCADITFEKLKELEYSFCKLDSVVEAALHNPNLIVHTVGAIMSIPRIEYSKGEYWMYKEVFTSKVWNLVNDLDNEKMLVLEALDLPKVKYVDACKNRNFEDDDIDATEAFFDYAYNHSPKGPDIPNSRYITEDVSEGLCLLESLGKLLNVKTTVASALIDLSNALLKCDFRGNGRSLDKLGLDNVKKVLDDII